MTHLPQPLWELGSSNLPVTEVNLPFTPSPRGLTFFQIILRFLLRIVHRKSRLIHTKVALSLFLFNGPSDSCSLQTIASLRSKLVPYFIITHAVRGNLPGPYSKLPAASRLRRLALDLVATINQGPTRNDDLSSAVDLTVEGTEEQNYWVRVQNSLFAANHGV